LRLNNHPFPRIIYVSIFFVGIVIGINSFYLNHTIHFKHLIEFFISNPKEIAFNLFEKSSAQDTLSLFINRKNFAKLEDNRKLRLATVNNSNFNHKVNNIKVKAKIRHRNSIIKSKIKLFGYNKDHWGNSSKWSFRVNIKGFESYRQSKQFNLLVPNTRGYLFDYLINKIVADFNFISIDYYPVHLDLNGYDKGIYLFEDFFNKYLIEKNNKKDSMIFTRNKKSGKIGINHPKLSKTSNAQRALKIYLESNPNEFYQLLDKEKLIVCLAISYLFQSDHLLLDGNLHWYYNPHSNMIEPILREAWPVKSKSILKNKCNIKSIVKFFSSKNISPVFTKFLLDNSKEDKKFESNFLLLMMEISEKYISYLNSEEYLKFQSVLKNESVINNWVVMQGLKAVENYSYQYGSLSQKIINNEHKPSKIDSVIYNGLIDIDKTILFDNNQILIIKKGSTINFTNNANLILKGGIEIQGTDSNPVKIFNSDSTRSSILVVNAKRNSTVSNTHFYRLSSLSEGIWTNTSAVTFYNSNVKIINSRFINNIEGDDALNIVNTISYSIDGCVFSEILSDAIDIDYSDGLISNSTFKKIGNDAIDFSGSNSKIINCLITDAGDKGVSAGENSTLTVETSNISKSKFGIVSKDLSSVLSLNNSFDKNKYDFSVYNKKEEYGPAILNDKKSIGAKVILLQDESMININSDNLIFEKFDYKIIDN
jgi:hypothetical protein